MRQDEPDPPRTGGGPTREQLERATPTVGGGREVRVGMFLLLGFVSTVILLFLLTDPAAFRGRYMLVTEVDDAGGVRRGDAVQMRGVNIGRVREFQMRPPRVAITLEIEGKWEIPADSHTRISGLGLLNGRTIEIVPGESDAVIPHGGMLPGVAGGDLMGLADTLGDDAVAIASSLREVLDERTVASIRTSATEMEQFLDVLTATAVEQRVELARLTRTLSSSAEQIDGALESADLEQALARADSTLILLQQAGASLDRAGHSLDGILARVEQGEGTLGQLATNDELYRNLNGAAEAILLLAQDVQENPSRYIRLRIF